MAYNEFIPEEWLKVIICPLHKKGDELDCKNYRAITLSVSANKIAAYNVLFERFELCTENIIEQYQCAFTAGKSTTLQIQAQGSSSEIVALALERALRTLLRSITRDESLSVIRPMSWKAAEMIAAPARSETP
uniref:Uncharacterized protein LOC114347087 n=1 Tax=Diabrotica virgifera virgifera TaxID=50390 RepID=A0A6P7GV36_DIAVI